MTEFNRSKKEELRRLELERSQSQGDDRRIATHRLWKARRRLKGAKVLLQRQEAQCGLCMGPYRTKNLNMRRKPTTRIQGESGEWVYRAQWPKVIQSHYEAHAASRIVEDDHAAVERRHKWLAIAREPRPWIAEVIPREVAKAFNFLCKTQGWCRRRVCI